MFFVGGIILVVIVAVLTVWCREKHESAVDVPTLSFPVDTTTVTGAWDSSASASTIRANIAGAIVNHHLLAAHYIAKTLKTIDPEKVHTILLISPDHFGHTNAPLTTTDATWQTAFGSVAADYGLISKLHLLGVVASAKPLNDEHGIGNIIPFLHLRFPGARVVPLLVRADMTINHAVTLADAIAPKLPTGTIIIGSFDFSHGHTADIADTHDAVSLTAIKARDYQKFAKLDVDSPAGLALLVRLMEKRGATNFDLIAHDNAGRLLHDGSMTNTTSYIDGVFIAADK